MHCFILVDSPDIIRNANVNFLDLSQIWIGNLNEALCLIYLFNQWIMFSEQRATMLLKIFVMHGFEFN